MTRSAPLKQNLHCATKGTVSSSLRDLLTEMEQTVHNYALACNQSTLRIDRLYLPPSRPPHILYSSQTRQTMHLIIFSLLLLMSLLLISYLFIC